MFISPIEGIRSKLSIFLLMYPESQSRVTQPHVTPGHPAASRPVSQPGYRSPRRQIPRLYEQKRTQALNK